MASKKKTMIKICCHKDLLFKTNELKEKAKEKQAL